MLFSIELDSKLPTSGASIKSMDVEKLFGVYGGVILDLKQSSCIFPVVKSVSVPSCILAVKELNSFRFTIIMLVYQRVVHPIDIPFNQYKILSNHYTISSNPFEIPWNLESWIINHYKIPFNHHKILLNHPKIPWNHYKIP